ncbi:MAG TPA: CcmD family protein [Vicinamibacterales bacterium]|jgi:CcmD family protein|nr:CcmD family protein [Vicinamibacterales bacterium]
MMRRLLFTLWLAAAAAAPALALQPPAAQSEYVPVKDLPPVDQLPGAPLLVAAYSFIWLAAMFYLWTIWRRLNKVETEMRALEQRQNRGSGR